MSTEGSTHTERGPSVAVLFYGIFVLVVVLVAGGLWAGIGMVELTIWLALVICVGELLGPKAPSVDLR